MNIYKKWKWCIYYKNCKWYNKERNRNKEYTDLWEINLYTLFWLEKAYYKFVLL